MRTDQQKGRKMAKRYKFVPAGIDRFDRRPHHPAPGTVVTLTPKGDRNIIGCPPQGTMGHVFISDAETGRFIGLVAKVSLKPVE